jgi:hypothetical protein
VGVLFNQEFNQYLCFYVQFIAKVFHRSLEIRSLSGNKAKPAGLLPREVPSAGMNPD